MLLQCLIVKAKKKQYSRKHILIADIIGWVGAALVVSAYLCNSFGLIEARTYLFQIINLVGAAAIVVSTFVRGAYPSATANTIWAGIALVTIGTMVFAK